MADGSSASAPRRSLPTLGFAAGACLAAAGWVIGLRPLSDNSFFTHLATGRLILDRGSVPSVDPYSFTALGDPWVVQSWLASSLYASVESLAGAAGLRVLMGVVAASLVVLAWRLLRPAESLLVRLALGALFVVAGAQLWAERPLMFGLLAFGATMLVAEGGLDPRWLVPLGWGWVNVHGSFPLGLVYLVVVIVGARLDARSAVQERRALGWLLGGVVLGAVGPLGPKVLVFPLELLQRQDVLRNVIEWRAPTFEGLSQRAFLLQLVLAVILLVRRPSYRSGLVVAVFGAAALLGARNLSVASLAFLPAMAAAAPPLGSLRSGLRSRLSLLLAAAAVGGALVLGSARFAQPDFELRGYPVDALAYLDATQVDRREHAVAVPDVVGNFLELVDGPVGEVFYDDRFDMFPEEVSAAHLALVRTDPALRSSLERFEIELVMWGRDTATGQWMIAAADWRILYTDERWILACLRGAELGGAVGRC